MKPKHQRMVFVACAIAIMALAASVIALRFGENLIYFYTPTMLMQKQKEAAFSSHRTFRLGGLVKQGSIEHPSPGVVTFVVSDGTVEYKASYEGIPPTLFREGQGVVMLATLVGEKEVKASEILAKHDENYMPPEVARALKDSKHWGGEGSSYPTGEGK